MDQMDEQRQSAATAASVEAGYEISDVNIPAIVIFAIFCLVTIVTSIFALDGYFVYYKEKLLQEARQYPNTELIELRSNEIEKLTSYGVFDKGKGIYRIPVDRAMELLAEEAFNERTLKRRQ